MVNPERPRYFENTGGGLAPLENSECPYFQRGDIVLISFRLGFVVGGTAWNSELIPSEMVRVGKLGDLLNDTVVWPNDNSMALMSGDFLPADGESCFKISAFNNQVLMGA